MLVSVTAGVLGEDPDAWVRERTRWERVRVGERAGGSESEGADTLCVLEVQGGKTHPPRRLHSVTHSQMIVARRAFHRNHQYRVVARVCRCVQRACPGAQQQHLAVRVASLLRWGALRVRSSDESE